VYESIAALVVGDFEDLMDLPRVLQLGIEGLNQLGEPIMNSIEITFTKRCGQYPAFFEGQSAGWVRLVSVLETSSFFRHFWEVFW